MYNPMNTKTNEDIDCLHQKEEIDAILNIQITHDVCCMELNKAVVVHAKFVHSCSLQDACFRRVAHGRIR